MSKNLKIKVGVEIDSAKTKMELDNALRLLQKNRVKIGFEVDTKSLNELKKTLDSFKNIKINVGTNGSNTNNSLKGMSDSVKTTNVALNEQKQIYSELKRLQSEEYAIKKQLVTATGEHKNLLNQQLDSIKQQQTATRGLLTEGGKSLTNKQSEVKLTQQIAKQESELARARAKANSDMEKAIANAQKNMNTTGFNSKQIEDYKRQLEDIDRTNMKNVRSEIESIGKAMDEQRNAMKNFGEEVVNIGSAMQSAGTAILEVFALPMAGVMYATETMKEYTYEMSRVQAISQANTEEMAKLDEMTKELGRTTVWSNRHSPCL